MLTENMIPIYATSFFSVPLVPNALDIDFTTEGPNSTTCPIPNNGHK